MPWQNNDGQQGGGGNGPWGSQPPKPPSDKPPQGQGGPNRGDPGRGGPGRGGPMGGGQQAEFELWLRRLRQWLRGSVSNGGGQQNIAGIIALVVFALWLLSGFYRVQPDEQGIPKVFGKARTEIVGPGLHYIWPDPIGSVVISRTGTERRITIPESRNAADPGQSLMLTGDENIIDIEFVVFWKINDPVKYEFDVRDQETVIARAAESAIREVIGETPIQTALTEGREEISTKTRDVLQKMLDSYGAGVTIDNIGLQAVSPPPDVVDAFNDVQRARSEAERTRNDAETYRNSILPQAAGEAARKKQDAIGYQAEVVNRATGDADRFKAVYQSYSAAKDVTLRRIYLETMEEVLKHSRKIVTDTPAGTPIVLPYAPPATTTAPETPK
jgi:membrane protease subunit HflK